MEGPSAPAKVLVVEPGVPEAGIAARHGEYYDWFRAVPDVDARGFEVARPFRGEEVPPLERYDAVIVTGAQGAVYEPEPWLAPFGERLRAFAAGGGAVLGVCYGHQLLGHLFGGRVVKNPLGREIGTVQISLTPAGRQDELLGQLPAGFAANATHGDIVVDLPWALPVLATNENTAVQAARFAPRAWGVQFHPEISQGILRSIIESRAAAIRAEGRDPEALAASVTDAPRASTILPRFLRIAAAASP
jgi:GMP synthase (glutamine-hydrolysing)